MTDHEEIRYLLRAILGELRVANEIAARNIESDGLVMAPNGAWVPVTPSIIRRISQIREEYNAP